MAVINHQKNMAVLLLHISYSIYSRVYGVLYGDYIHKISIRDLLLPYFVVSYLFSPRLVYKTLV